MAALGNVYRIEHVCFGQGQLGEMVSHWVVDSMVGPGATDPEIAAFFGGGAWAAAIKALLSSTMSFRGARAQNVFPPPVLASVAVNTSAGPGTVAGDLMSTQTSGLISLATNFAGRRFRGRKYMPFPGEADNDATGVPTAGYLTRLAALRNLFTATQSVVGGAGTTNFKLVIFHKGGNPVPTVVTGAIAQPIWATQRRRGSYGRPNNQPF